MEPNDPSNTLGNPVPTHINAYYGEYAEAQEALAVAQGRVNSLAAKIVELGGTVPTSEPVETPAEEKAKEPVRKSKKVVPPPVEPTAPVDVPAVPSEPVAPVETPASTDTPSAPVNIPVSTPTDAPSA